MVELHDGCCWVFKTVICWAYWVYVVNKQVARRITLTHTAVQTPKYYN